MPIGIYFDVHIPAAISHGLKLRDVNVLTAQEDGTTRLRDRLLLSRVTELEMMLYTFDDDLLIEAKRRIRSGEVFTGVVHSHALYSPVGPCIDSLEIIAKALEPADLVCRVEYIPF